MAFSVQAFELAHLLEEEEEEEHDDFVRLFKRLSDELVRHGLLPHDEPKKVPAQVIETGADFPTESIHALRRVYVYVTNFGHLPEPLVAQKAASDPTLREYYKQEPSSHLVHFSDASGFYVPQSFVAPIEHSAVGSIGSSFQLGSELISFAEAIGFEVIDAGKIDSMSYSEPGASEVFALERLLWKALLRAVKQSVQYGTAIRIG